MRTVRVMVGVALCVLMLSETALALTGSVLLGFGASYVSAEGAVKTHHGVDVALASGTGVTSPVGGTVSFAGRVPGPDGGSVLAVSIESADGVVSMLPLESLDIDKGDAVAPGARVGSLAESGDPSSAAPHLHLGLKRGGLYVDPSGLVLAAAWMQPETVPSAQAQAAQPAEGAGQPSAQNDAGAPAHAHATAVSGVAPAVSPAPASQPRSGAAPLAGVSSVGVEVPSAVPLTEGQIAPGVSLAPGNAAPSAPAVLNAPRGAARAPGATRGTRTTAKALSSRGLGLPAVGVAAAAIFSATILLTRRAFANPITGATPVSDRLGTLLQHLKAGDTLCGLTSCSGPTAFTVPGPLAQRR